MIIKHHGNSTMQNNNRKKQINETMRKTTNVLEISAKKGVLSKYCQKRNTNSKKQLINLLPGNRTLQIVDMCNAFIWTIFNLFDPHCSIDSKVQINFIIIPKFLTFIP